jgi:hypothetical protein
VGHNKLTNSLVPYGTSGARWTALAYTTDAEFRLIPIRNEEDETWGDIDKLTLPPNYSHIF